MNTKTKYNKALEQETNDFLSLCTKKDAMALIFHKEEDGTEEIVRIAVLSLVCGYNKLFFKILANLKREEADICVNKLNDLDNDFETINKWMTEFISNIENNRLKKDFLPYWEEYAKEVDRKTFSLKDFFKFSQNKCLN